MKVIEAASLMRGKTARGLLSLPGVSGRSTPRIFLIFSLALLFYTAPSTLYSQYFGQNKVNYRNYDWHYIKTEHFDIYHPKESFQIAEYAGWKAEEALRSIEASWNYKLQGRIIFVVYPSHNAFQSNNVGSGTPDESTGGFTEFLKNRVVIPFQGSYEMFEHVIHHELTHAVMLRMLYGEGVQSILTGLSRLPLPLWYIEGLAEYESRGGWGNEADMYLRDAIINDYLMPINRLAGYFTYKGGQSVLYYLEERYGKKKIGELQRRIRARRDFNGAVKEVVGIDLEELSKRWHRHLKRQIWPTGASFEAPEDFAVRVTNHEELYNFINTSPALSPNGDRLAMLSDKDDYMSLYLVNTVNNKVEKRLVKGGSQIYLFEQLLWLRPWIDWSPDGKELAFVAEAGPEDVLYTLNVESGQITRELRFGLDGIFSPSWSPDGTQIVFSGHDGKQSDLYVVDVDQPATLARLTDDQFSDYDPDWGRDGKILFVSDRRDEVHTAPESFDMWQRDVSITDAYMIDPESRQISRITSDPHQVRTPTWTSRGDTISFVSDRTGAFNLYLMDLKSIETWASTDVLTGVFTPSWSDQGTVAFASFYHAGYDIYLYKNPFARERRKSPALTYHQQKVRGLLDESLPDEELISERTRAMLQGGGEPKPDSGTRPVEFVRGQVQPGSADEDSIRAAIGDPEEDEEKPSPGEQALRLVKEIPDSIRSVARDTTSIDSVDGTILSQPGSGGVRFVSINRRNVQPQRMSTYRNYVFYPEGMDDYEDVAINDTEPVEADSLFTEDGSYIQRKYKVKFSPDIVYAAAGYNTFFGLQGYGQVMLSDVLGNHIIFVGTDLYYSIENSNFDLFYYYLPNRLDVGGGVFHNVYFFDYGDIRDRNYGGSLSLSYPFSRNRRLDFSGAFVNIDRDRWSYLDRDHIQYQTRHFVLPTAAYVFDNTIWGYTGPVVGTRYRAAFSYSPKFGDADPATASTLWGIDFKTLSFDARKYYSVGRDYSFALRLAGASSWGENPQTFFLGGVSNWINRRFQGGIRINIDDIYFSGFATPLRGADYYEKWGNRYLLSNTEFRFPLVHQLFFGWPLPFFFYNIRGALFLDVGSAWNDNDFRGTHVDSRGITRFRDIELGYGWGARLNLGYFLLKFDVAWENDLYRVSKPKYYFSLGADI